MILSSMSRVNHLVADDVPAIARETVDALTANVSFRYMLRPVMPQTGTRVPVNRVPGPIVARSDDAINRAFAPNLTPPISGRAYVGYRKPPSFEDEFMWLSWRADDRRILWLDLDYQVYILLELKPGELREVDDTMFKSGITSWIAEQFRVPAGSPPLSASVVSHVTLPSGRILRTGAVTLGPLTGPVPSLPESDRWALSFSYWTDGRVICLEAGFPTVRPPEAPSSSGAGHRKHPYTRSRFDPPRDR